MSKRFLLFSAALPLVSLGLAPGAMAQQAASDPVVTTPVAAVEEADDEIVITGSRIKRNAADQAIAVTEIGQEEIQQRGFVNAIEALEQVPLVGIGTNAQGQTTQFGDSNAFVNLFGFGTQRTLTLIDGRRTVTSNQGTVFVPGNVSGAQVDLTTINPALIKRTEVQTVGSGPIYGADAVAGVVNVILDRDFTGVSILGQGGFTDDARGGNYRFSGAWGDDVLNGKGHVVVSAEYFNQDEIVGGFDRFNFATNIGAINNPFSFSATDGIPNTIFQRNQLNPQVPAGGLLALRQINVGFPAAVAGNVSGGGVAQFILPTRLGDSANDAAFNTFVARTGQTPFLFASANPTLNGIDPLLFLGTFGLPSLHPSVANTDPATLALGLTRRAVPLTFDANGNPVPFNFGNIIPPNVTDQDDVVGGGGFGGDEFLTIQAAQERINFSTLFKYDFTPNFRYEGDVWFAQVRNDLTSDNTNLQSPGCNLAAAACGVPIFFNQNPFVTPATLAQVNAITAANAGQNAAFNFATIGGQPFFALTRSLADIQGGFDNREGNRSRTYRTTHALEGDFTLGERNFDWDVAFAFSRNTSLNNSGRDILDIEFALATDVVVGPNGQPVCRQQTLAAPEAVNLRNPQLTNININTPGGLVPTAAQIAACTPLNLFGVGNASQAAIDYVTGVSTSFNEATQFYGSASFGGELFPLPGGPFAFNTQFEWRRESLVFSPDQQFSTGSGRQTIGQASDGSARFFEGGFEFAAPIFGKDFRIPVFHRLELSGAVRVVNRSGSGTPFGIGNGIVDVTSSTAPTFTGGGIWSPIKDITFRGNRTRAVRSPSLVESLGAPQTGFSALASAFPCNAFNRNLGPTSGIRITNCNAFEASLGLAAGTFAGLQPANAAVPAGVGGNPTLANEVSNNWTVGVVIQPRFIPGLTITSDYYNLLLDNNITLTFLGTQCFDQPEFPNTVIGGIPVCEAINLAVADPVTGEVRIPGTNIITGSPTIAPAVIGSLAPVQSPFTIAAAQFSNVNQGSRALEAINSTINYGFALPQAFGVDLGGLDLRGTVYYIRKFGDSSSGRFDDTNTLRGEPGTEVFNTRLDVQHSIGKLTHSWQWFRTGESVGNADSTAPRDGAPNFFLPAFNTFNYNAQYAVTDNITARFIVNNVTDARLKAQFGFGGAGNPASNVGDLIGRTFVFAVQARF